MSNLNTMLLSVLFTFGFGGAQQAFGQCADDTWAPIIVFPSQAIVTALDPCGLGTAIVFFEVTVTDNCDGIHFPSATGAVTPGSEFAITVFPAFSGGVLIALPGSSEAFAGVFAPGTYQILIEAEDAAGNLRQE